MYSNYTYLLHSSKDTEAKVKSAGYKEIMPFENLKPCQIETLTIK